MIKKIHKFDEIVKKLYKLVNKFYDTVNFWIEKNFLEVFLFWGFKKSEIKTEISHLFTYIVRPVCEVGFVVVWETLVETGKIVSIFGKIVRFFCVEKFFENFFEIFVFLSTTKKFFLFFWFKKFFYEKFVNNIFNLFSLLSSTNVDLLLKVFLYIFFLRQ